MTWNVAFNEKHNFVQLSFDGEVSASDIFNSSFEAINLSQTKEVNKIFVDSGKVIVTFGHQEAFKLPSELYNEWNLSVEVKIALVEPRDTYSSTIAEFYRFSAHKLGWNVEVFKKSKDAINWLLLAI